MSGGAGVSGSGSGPASSGAPELAALSLPLAADWQDWITGELLKGVSVSVLAARLTGAGFEPDEARVVVRVMQALTERVQREAPLAVDDFQPDPLALAGLEAGGTVLAGRRVRYGWVMRDPHLVSIDDFLTHDECALMLGWARTQGASTGTRAVTSADLGLISAIEARVRTLVGSSEDSPVTSSLRLMNLPYGPASLISLHGDQHEAPPGPPSRASLIVCLEAPAAGGAWWMPELDLSLNPRPGSAVYVEYGNRQGQFDRRCLLTSQPVSEGEGWVAIVEIGPPSAGAIATYPKAG